MPASTRRSATSWAASPGVAMMPIEISRSATTFLRSDIAETLMPEIVGADPLGVAVDQGSDADAAGAESLVGRERRAEIADADDDDVPVLVLTDLESDLVAEVLDVVADPAGAVGAEVREVLAQLGGVDAGLGGEVIGRARADALLGESVEGAQIDRKPGHGGVGDATLWRTGRRPVAKYRHGAPALRGRGLSRMGLARCADPV